VSDEVPDRFQREVRVDESLDAAVTQRVRPRSCDLDPGLKQVMTGARRDRGMPDRSHRRDGPEEHPPAAGLRSTVAPGRHVVSDLDTEIVMRIDSASAASALCQAAQDAGINFLVGFDLFTGVREAILSLPADAWRPAIRQDGEEREGAQVAEITHVERLDLTPWSDGSRVIIRRERPHPGAQLTFTDHEGHRFQATLTDLDGDPVEIECLHRGRANAEDRIQPGSRTFLSASSP
jgi:Transposase DDE domain group 1